MNAMDLMKALGDIPEDLVKCCFDEETAEYNNVIPSAPISSDVSNPIIPYKADNTDDKHDLTPEASTHDLRFLKYFFTFAACLLIIVGPPLIISQLKNKPTITPDDPVVPTQTQEKTEIQPLVTATDEVNTSAKKTTTTITSATTSVNVSESSTVSEKTTNERPTTTETETEHQISAETTNIKTEENIILKTTETVSSVTDTEIITTSKTTTTEHIEDTKLSVRNNGQELSQTDLITLEIGVPLVLDYTASGKPEISTETNDFNIVIDENAKTINITANDTTYSRVYVTVPGTNEGLYFTVSALHVDYRTVTEYDDSPMHVGETREIHFYHPQTQTAKNAFISEVSDNISVQYTEGEDLLTITALETGDSKLYVMCDGCAFGSYVNIHIS